MKGNKSVLMVGGYTFAKTTKRHYYCSKKAKGCKARVFLNVEGTEMIFCDNSHDHDPPIYAKCSKGIQYEIVTSQRGNSLLLVGGYTFSKINKKHWVCSKKFPECKAKLKLNGEGIITDISNVHIHPPKTYIKTMDDDFKFIMISGNKRLLMVKGYTFAKTNKRHWYCSKKAKGCKARVNFNDDESEVVFCDNNHQHEPPVYAISSNGFYVKLSG